MMRHDNPEASSMFNGERWVCEARSEYATFNDKVVYAACTSGPDMATLAAVHALTDKSGNVALGGDFYVDKVFRFDCDKWRLTVMRKVSAVSCLLLEKELNSLHILLGRGAASFPCQICRVGAPAFCRNRRCNAA